MNRIANLGIVALSFVLVSASLAIAQDEIRVVDYGANCDDVNGDYGDPNTPPSDDDTPALLAATEALYTTGARILSLRGCKTLTLSDSWLVSTFKHNGIEIVGDGAGVGNDLFDIPAYGLNYFIQQGGSRIFWKGDVGGTMLTVQGPINGVEIRGIQFDAGHRAGTAIEVQHCWACKFSQLSIVNYTGTAIVSTTLPGIAPPALSHGTGANIWEQILVSAPFGNNTTSGILLTGDTSTPFNTTWTTVRDSLFVYGGGIGTSGIEFGYADNITIDNVYAIAKEDWDVGGNSLKFTRQIGSGCGGTCDQFPKENSIYKFMGHQPIGGTHGLGGGGSVILPLSLDDSIVDGTGTPRVLPVEPIENLRILTNRGDFYGPFAFDQLTVGDLPQVSHSADVVIVREDVDAIMTINTVSDGDVMLKHRLDGVNEYTWTARRPFGELDLSDLSLNPNGHPTRYISVVPGSRSVRLFDTSEADGGLGQFMFNEDGMARLRGTSFTSLDSPLPGEFTWCTDCGTGPSGECVAAGPGRWAFGTGGTSSWQCPF